MRLPTITASTLAALALVACTPNPLTGIPALDGPDSTSPCSDTYVAVVNASGNILCVNPIYLEPPFQHPSECVGGYYQGSCLAQND